MVIVGSFGLVEVRNQTLPKIDDDHPHPAGQPGDDASGRYAPCAIIPRQTLLHHLMGRDLAGEMKVNDYAAIKKSFLGKPTHLLMPKGMLSLEKMGLDQIASAEIVTDTDSLQRRAGWAALGAVVLGPVGLLAGVLAGKKTVVAVEFKDERRALLECGSGDVAALKAACF